MRRIRLAFDGGEHLHFEGLLAAALAAPSAEVVGMAIADDELRQWFSGAHPEVPAFADADELYESVGPEAVITCADNARARGGCPGGGSRCPCDEREADGGDADYR